MPQSEQRILIIGPAWVGDMVMAQSLFMSLKEANPKTSIDVLAPEWSKPLLQRMPEVNTSISQPLGHGQFGLLTRYHLGKQLRVNHYDVAIILPRSFKSALIPYFAKARVRTGYKGEMRYGLLNDIRSLDKAVLTQTVQRYVALGQSKDTTMPPVISEPALSINKQNQSKLLQNFGLSLNRPVVGLMPGAEYGPAKQWPLQHYALLAKQLINEGFQIWLFGSSKDSEAAAQIELRSNDMKNHCIDLTGKTQLADAVDLLALTTAVVTNDSGLMHIAAAVGAHVVAIYGSSTPEYTPPLTKKSTIMYQSLECSPCFERRCPLGHTNCLNSITPDMVMEKIEGLSNIKQSQSTVEGKGN